MQVSQPSRDIRRTRFELKEDASDVERERRYTGPVRQVFQSANQIGWQMDLGQPRYGQPLRTPTSLRMIHGASFSSSCLVETELGSIGPKADISLGILILREMLDEKEPRLRSDRRRAYLDRHRDR